MTSFVGIGLIAVNCIVSYLGIRDQRVIDKYCFHIEKIRVNREYLRLITSGFLHVNWMHLFFNMFSLYVFSELLETLVGWGVFFAIYMISLLSGNLLALFIHRNHPNYKAVGASGAVSGIIFSSIALYPGLKIGLFLIPIGVPSWVFALGYILFTLYGIRSRNTNIGHEAHLGGALGGMFLAIAFHPEAIGNNLLPILVVTIPSILFIILIALKPGVLELKLKTTTTTGSPNQTIDDQYNEKKIRREREMDRILQKINDYGLGSLTDKEKQFLDEASKK